MQIQLDLERLRQSNIFIATPMYGGQAAGLYIKSILDLQGLLMQNGIKNRYSFLFNESLITRARNYLADEFLRSDCTHLLFIDSDIEFNPLDVLAMLHFDKDIIGGPYPKKTIKWSNIDAAYKKSAETGNVVNPAALEMLGGDYVFNPVPGTKQFRTDDLVEVMEIGTGFMLIKREVFEQFIEEYPHLRYKPDHAGAANFDGTRYIHAFFDTVIDPETHRYLSEDYFFCIDGQSRVETEDGIKKISEIVKNNYNGKVATINPHTNEKEWKNISGWSARKNDSGKKWVKLESNNNNNRLPNLICTSDHKIAYVDDIMNINENDIKFTEAVKMGGKYSIRQIQNNENALYSVDQLEFLIGSLLGDSHINKNGQMSFVHSNKQIEYLEMKKRLFGGGDIYTNKTTGSVFKKDVLISSFVLPVNVQTKKLRELFYDDNGKRTVRNIIDMITEKSLAFWYMDDGSIQKNRIRLHTESLSYDDNVLLMNMFSEKFDIHPTIHKIYRNYKEQEREYYQLHFGLEDTKKFMSLISPYIHISMKHKMTDEFDINERNDIYDFDSVKSLGFSARYIRNVKYLSKHHSRLYDISVNDNHNFFANGSLVHNCQMARAMGRSIWYCPWMQTTHVGSYGFKGNLPAIAQLVGNL